MVGCRLAKDKPYIPVYVNSLNLWVFLVDLEGRIPFFGMGNRTPGCCSARRGLSPHGGARRVSPEVGSGKSGAVKFC